MSQSRHVLIVEDNAAFRIFERTVLEKAGFRVSEACRAKEAVEKAETLVPDIILMDIKLPSKKRGIGAARILRKNPKTRDIPIIFVTAYEHGTETREVTNISACGYLTKPCEKEELLQKVEEFLAES